MAASAARASVPFALPVIATSPAASLPERAEQADEFVRLAAVREQQGDVVRVDHAEVAVDGAGGVEGVGAGAGGVERADELLADVRGLADAGDRDAAAAVEEHVGDAVEPVAETRRDRLERRGLDSRECGGRTRAGRTRAERSLARPCAGCGTGSQTARDSRCV